MRNTTIISLALATCATACQSASQPRLEPSNANSEPSGSARAITTDASRKGAERKLYLDVHEIGPGKVSTAAVAQAHQKDLATQGEYDVDFEAYWVDEQQGKIYCLARAPSAAALTSVHREAHGLLPSQVMEVTGDSENWSPTPGKKLFLDVHHFGPGKVDAAAVAQAHQKDLAVQDAYDVKYLNYWFDAASGTVMCLSESPSSDSSLAVHKQAHGLVPDSIEEVSEGR